MVSADVALPSSMHTVSVASGTRLASVVVSLQLAASSHTPSAPIQLIVQGPRATAGSATSTIDGSTSNVATPKRQLAMPANAVRSPAR